MWAHLSVVLYFREKSELVYLKLQISIWRYEVSKTSNYVEISWRNILQYLLLIPKPISKYCTSRINVLVGLISEFFYPVAWWLPVYLNPHLYLPCNHISSAGWVRTIRTSRKRCISTIFLLKKNKHIIHDIIFLNTRNYILNRK